MIIVSDSNMARLEPVIMERIAADKTVKVITLPGKIVKSVFDEEKLRLWATMEGRNLAVITGGLNDVLNHRAVGIAKQIAKRGQRTQVGFPGRPD